MSNIAMSTLTTSGSKETETGDYFEQNGKHFYYSPFTNQKSKTKNQKLKTKQ